MRGFRIVAVLFFSAFLAHADQRTPEVVWTEWLNRDAPGGTGDYETLPDFVAKGQACAAPTAIQCQTLDGVDYRRTGQGYRCEPLRGGICVNRDQPPGQPCRDYRVRFACPADEAVREAIVEVRIAGARRDARAGADRLRATRDELEAVKRQVLASLPSGSFEVVNRYPNLGLLFVRLKSAEAAALLERHPLVVRVHENGSLKPLLAESLPLIGATQVHGVGWTAAGTSVAVIDTGVDWRGPQFGSCAKPGELASCRVVQAWECAGGVCREAETVPTATHGTHMAAIVAAVAPEARIISYDVCELDCPDVNILAALDRIVDLPPGLRPAAVNISIGTDEYYELPCYFSFYEDVFQRLRVLLKIPSVCGSGNWAYISEQFREGVGRPACAPSAISVGGTYDAQTIGNVVPAVAGTGGCVNAFPGGNVAVKDRVLCASQTAKFLSFLAPGCQIELGAAYPSCGTSPAAAHVSGAVAIMRSAYPDASLTEIENSLKANAMRVVDPRIGQTQPRIDLTRLFAVAWTPSNYGNNTWFDGNGRERQPLAGDFNGDGFADLAYYGKCGGGSGHQCWRVHLNDRNGAFVASDYGGNAWFGGRSYVHAPVAGDFDNDGFTDIAYAGRCGGGAGHDCWRVHLNDRNGTFGAADYGGGMWFDGDSPIKQPVAGDFNGDSFADIAYYGRCGGGKGQECWRVHLNDRNGNLVAANYGGEMWFGGHTFIHAPVAGDFNGDGFADIAYYGRCGGGKGQECWRVHINNRQGRFAAANYGWDGWFDGDTAVKRPVASDFNGDGFADIAYYGRCGGGKGQECWRVHINNRQGRFAAANFGGDMWFGGNTVPRIPVAGSFDGDKASDLAYFGLCGSGTPCWRVHLGRQPTAD